MVKRSKYYYDYTRNMSVEQELNFCKKENCDKSKCNCANSTLTQEVADAFEDWMIDLTNKEQPESCDIDDADCENCGS